MKLYLNYNEKLINFFTMAKRQRKKSKSNTDNQLIKFWKLKICAKLIITKIRQ